MAYTKYSLTPANNTAAPPDGAPEGMLPSAVNDTMRDMMAQIRDCGDGIRDGTYTMTAPKITGGTITGATFTGNTFSNPIVTGVSTFAAGTVSLPSITTTGDTNTGIFFPTADTIAFTEGGVESMRIDSSGDVLIGKTSATANGGDLQVSSGITFPATQVAKSDANTLDDYEEGTWTPSVGGNATYFNQDGRYTKIGNTVFIEGHLNINVLGTGSVSTLSGLPFAAGTVVEGGATINFFAGLAVNVIQPVMAVNSANTTMIVYSRTTAGTGSSAVNVFGDAARIYFWGHYLV